VASQAVRVQVQTGKSRGDFVGVADTKPDAFSLPRATTKVRWPRRSLPDKPHLCRNSDPLLAQQAFIDASLPLVADLESASSRPPSLIAGELHFRPRDALSTGQAPQQSCELEHSLGPIIPRTRRLKPDARSSPDSIPDRLPVCSSVRAKYLAVLATTFTLRAWPSRSHQNALLASGNPVLSSLISKS
jgi:hypothetical protein